MDPNLGHLPEAILRKVPSPEENDWIIAKLAKAAEFAHVPGDWNIEPKKPIDEDEEEDGKLEGVARVKRTRTILDEDQLTEVWNGALVAVKQAADVVDRNQNADEDEGGDSDDEEMEDVEIGGEPAQNAGSASPPPPVAQQPMMSLDTIHRFMASGAVPH